MGTNADSVWVERPRGRAGVRGTLNPRWQLVDKCACSVPRNPTLSPLYLAQRLHLRFFLKMSQKSRLGCKHARTLGACLDIDCFWYHTAQ